MMWPLYVLIIINGLFISITCEASECVIKYPRDPENRSPLLLKYKQSEFDFMPLLGDGTIRLKNEDIIFLLCPGRGNKLVQSSQLLTEAVCKDKSFRIGETSHNFEDLTCASNPKADFQKTTVTCGDQKGIILNIGYKVVTKTKNIFLNLIVVCYNEIESITLFSSHVIEGGTVSASPDYRRPTSFSTAGLSTSVGIPGSYTQAYQKSHLSRLLKSAVLADTYINKATSHYLVRGHLTPDKDFNHVAHKSATYFLINAVPQWQSINNGNWKSLEYSIRKFAADYGHPLRIYTGTHGIMDLKDKNENAVQIYLAQNTKALPVPYFMWKIVYSPNTKKGIAFIALNNPFAQSPSRDICPNVCNDFKWNNEKFEDVDKGRIICCSVKDFRRIVHTLPDFEVTGNLSKM